MRLTLGLAVVGVVLLGAFSSASSPDSVEQAVACARGSLHTIYHGKHKCLSEHFRKRVYRAFARLHSRGISRRRAYELLSRRYRISPRSVRTIAREGVRNEWGRVPLPPPRGELLPPGASGAASDLNAITFCTETTREGVARLTWKPAARPGSGQRVDLTIYRDGFETGMFDSSTELAPDRSSLEWDRLSTGAIHFWRVLTRHKDGWAPTATTTFGAPACVVDLQPGG